MLPVLDTRFELGPDNDGKLYLGDEILTPGSSCFWPKDRGHLKEKARFSGLYYNQGTTIRV